MWPAPPPAQTLTEYASEAPFDFPPPPPPMAFIVIVVSPPDNVVVPPLLPMASMAVLLLEGTEPPAPTVIVYVPFNVWPATAFTWPPPPPPADPLPPPPTNKISAVTALGNVMDPDAVNVYTAYTSVAVA